jgi:hypothetical protein
MSSARLCRHAAHDTTTRRLVKDGLIAEITTFDATLFDAFGLPRTL